MEETHVLLFFSFIHKQYYVVLLKILNFLALKTKQGCIHIENHIYLEFLHCFKGYFFQIKRIFCLLAPSMYIRRNVEIADRVFPLTQLLNLLKLNTTEDLTGPGSLTEIE